MNFFFKGDLATTIFHYLDNQGRNNNNKEEEEEVQRDTSPSRSEILSKSSSTCNLILISRFHKRELYQEYVDLLKPGKINIHHLRRRLLLLLTFVFDTCICGTQGY